MEQELPRTKGAQAMNKSSVPNVVEHILSIGVLERSRWVRCDIAGQHLMHDTWLVAACLVLHCAVCFMSPMLLVVGDFCNTTSTRVGSSSLGLFTGVTDSARSRPKKYAVCYGC